VYFKIVGTHYLAGNNPENNIHLAAHHRLKSRRLTVELSGNGRVQENIHPTEKCNKIAAAAAAAAVKMKYHAWSNFGDDQQHRSV